MTACAPTTLDASTSERQRGSSFRHVATTLRVSIDEPRQATDDLRACFALRAWFESRVREECQHAVRQGETPPTPQAATATTQLVVALAPLLVSDADLASDLSGDGEGGLILVIDRVVARRRVVVEVDAGGATRRILRVGPGTFIPDMNATDAMRATALAWLYGG